MDAATSVSADTAELFHSVHFAHRWRRLRWTQDEAETHVFAKPLHVVRTPAVVKQIEMDSARKIRLRFRKINRRHFPQRYQSRIQSFNVQRPSAVFISEAIETTCICRLPPLTTSNGESVCPTLERVQFCASKTAGLKVNQSASGIRFARLPNHFRCDMQRRFVLRKQQIQITVLRPGSDFGVLRLRIVSRATIRCASASSPAQHSFSLGVHTRLCAAKLLDIRFAEILGRPIRLHGDVTRQKLVVIRLRKCLIGKQRERMLCDAQLPVFIPKSVIAPLTGSSATAKCGAW